MNRPLVIAAHLHCTGQESADDVLHALDEAGIELAVLPAPHTVLATERARVAPLSHGA